MPGLAARFGLNAEQLEALRQELQRRALRKASMARLKVMTPEHRRKVALNAINTRWKRYRAKQRELRRQAREQANQKGAA